MALGVLAAVMIRIVSTPTIVSEGCAFPTCEVFLRKKKTYRFPFPVFNLNSAKTVDQ